MADNDDDLARGLYERLITRSLEAKLSRFDAARTRVERRHVDPADAHATLARHVYGLVSGALRSLPERDREAQQAALSNQLIALLSASDAVPDDPISFPPEQLRAIRELTGGAAMDVPLPVPLVPLSASDLLVNARGEPGLAQNLVLEIPSADSIDLICAFVRWHGLRVIEPQLAAHCRSGKPLRIITTVYTGSTERKALDHLIGLGAEVRVSYDTQSTRLHAKAWLFRRVTGYSTAYIGSSNLSKSALLDGVEWNVRLSEVTSPEILEKFDATFQSYWAGAEYESYETARDGERFDQAISHAGGGGATLDAPLSFFDIEPRAHQVEMLEKIGVERVRHGRHRNLLVAATGTGKTVVAALDFKRLRKELGDPRLLFVAHRQEILKQSLGMFRQILRESDFGELYVDGQQPTHWRHVFASVQSLSHLDLDRWRPEWFDVVIVDEFHHAAAPTYTRLLTHLRPKELLGLTATPERADGERILQHFDERIAVELRLWEALDRGLLSPFQYFALNDETDLRAVEWSRRGYDTAELERIYTADDARVRLVLRQLREKMRNPHEMRALGFCVSVAHADFMARRFSEAGLPAQSVSARTETPVRERAVADLRAGRLRVLFAVDLFNEGLDLPEIDTLLFLRPTESAVVFMQQLGRGLRRFEGKDCVTVLDFIGQAHRRFRYDLRYRAVTGASRSEVKAQIEAGFPFLPAGCTMQLDRVAREIVLRNLQEAIPSHRPAMVAELTALAANGPFANRPAALSEFLQETGLDLEDIYRSGCWSDLKRRAGLPVAPPGPREAEIGGRLKALLHVDDPLRLAAYAWAVHRRSTQGLNATEERLLLGLHFALKTGSDSAPSLDSALAPLWAAPALIDDLGELLTCLEDRSGHLTYPLNDELQWSHDVPLSIHARHTMDEVLTAFGLLSLSKTAWKQTGVVRDEATNSDLFFVTLDKSDRGYSPRTQYKDYPISPVLFHWESQSTTTQASPTGQRYLRHRELGGHILLFVRQRRKEDGRTLPYTFLGPVDYVSHKQERPIQIVWKLRRPMPADFFRQAKVVAG